MNKDVILDTLKSYPLAVFCIFLTVASGVGLFLRGGAASELSIVEADLGSQLRVVERNAEKSQNLDKDLKDLEQGVESVDGRLFKRDERAVNINFFYAFEDKTDVIITSIAQRANSDPIYAKKGPRALKNYSIIVYDISVSGTFRDILGFIEELSRVEPLIRVADYNLKGARGGNGVDARLRVIVLSELG